MLEPYVGAIVFVDVPTLMFYFNIDKHALGIIVNAISTSMPNISSFPDDNSTILYTVFIDGTMLRVYASEIVIIK